MATFEKEHGKAVVGETGSAFSVRVEEDAVVADLKDAIAEKQKYDFAASKLQLYVAKKNDVWLTKNEVNFVRDPNGLQLLIAARAKLHRVGLSKEQLGEVDEEEEAAGNGPVNVLVVVPPEEEQQVYKKIKISAVIKQEDVKLMEQNLASW